MHTSQEELILKTAIEAAYKAGEVLLDMLKRPREMRFKGMRDLVTDADLAAQAAIFETILRNFPDHAILAEETEGAKLTDLGTTYTWIIDPLDGTTNYSRRYPCFSISIAVSLEGEVFLGLVYEPFHNRLFHARRGKGAYLNGEALHVSSNRILLRTLVGFDWARGRDARKEVIEIISKIAPQVGTMRTSGSAALGMCSVATGWIDAYFGVSLKLWDAAASSLIVREAGGVISDLAGLPWKLGSPRCLATNGLIHEEILRILGS
jgi:myo-inositol-1(or 4)-monophosphatase